MPRLDSFLDCPDLRITELISDTNTVTIHAEGSSAVGTCPQCSTDSARVHSRYTRRIAGLPSQGKPVSLKLSARRFVCARRDCDRKLFCERFPEVVAAHARTTRPLTDSQREIGFALGGEAGARLCAKLSLPTSADTLLRRVKAATDEPSCAPRYIGVDDWATKKGQRYGTILIDLERRQVIDLLPGRDGQALKTWLQGHPGVEVITRDRWAAFAQAASEAAPQAKQVADRWHLLKNLREAVERLLSRYSEEVRDTARLPVTASDSVPAGQNAATPSAPEPSSVPPVGKEPSDRVKSQQANRAARQERHRLTRALRAEGLTIRAIARCIGLSVKAVTRYLRDGRCPDWNPGHKRPTQLDPYRAFIDQWVAQGGRNSADLFRLLRGEGCAASYDAVRRCVNRKVGSTGQPGPRVGRSQPPSPAIPSARKLSFQFIARPKDGRPAVEAGQGPSILDRLCERIPVLNTGLELAAELAGMLRKKVALPLADWLTKAEGSGIVELVNFATSLRKDEAAVAAALTESWSNGQVEGQVHRLKLIKRTMYGRAGMPLLRARVRRKG